MSKTIKVRKDKKTGARFLKLKDFSEFVDIKKVKYYTLEPVVEFDEWTQEEVKALILVFYDFNGNRLNTQEEIKNEKK